jgi:uncharacterized protein (UPF0179 family)
MVEAETIVTLIGVKLAIVGEEFIFIGGTSECEACRLKNACLNLEAGKKYRVVSKREGIQHECAVHDQGVCPVEVVEAPIIAAIDARRAFAGSKISYEPLKCEKNCGLYNLCHPEGVKVGEKYNIINVLGEPPETCRLGYALKLVELKR